MHRGSRLLLCNYLHNMESASGHGKVVFWPKLLQRVYISEHAAEANTTEYFSTQILQMGYAARTRFKKKKKQK